MYKKEAKLHQKIWKWVSENTYPAWLYKLCILPGKLRPAKKGNVTVHIIKHEERVNSKVNIYGIQHEEHKRLWEWVENNPDKPKDMWPEWESNGGTVLVRSNYCMGCGIAEELNKITGYSRMCQVCPIDWAGGGCCANYDSLWSRYASAVKLANYDQVRIIAKEIKNTPWKD